MMANDINKFTTIDKEYTNNYVYKANEESTKESLTSINDKLFLQQKVEEWINKDSDMARKLISKLEKITSYSNRLIYENVVMLIFYIASRPHEQSYFSFSVCLGCNENILINKIKAIK